MNYEELFARENEAVRERLELSLERIRAVVDEHTAAAPYDRYFKETAPLS